MPIVRYALAEVHINGSRLDLRSGTLELRFEDGPEGRDSWQADFRLGAPPPDLNKALDVTMRTTTGGSFRGRALGFPSPGLQGPVWGLGLVRVRHFRVVGLPLLKLGAAESDSFPADDHGGEDPEPQPEEPGLRR